MKNMKNKKECVGMGNSNAKVPGRNAPKRKNVKRDMYSDMYEDRLKKFQSMAGDGNDAGEEISAYDLRFYTEEELDVIEQAKRDAVKQAYDDAYREEYQKARQRAAGQRMQNSANSTPRRRQAQPTTPRRENSPSQRYAAAASEKHKGENFEFGGNNTYHDKPKKSARKSNAGRTFVGVVKGLFLIIIIILLLFQVLIFRYISMVNSVDRQARLVTDAELDDRNVKNILLIGSDTRDDEERGRTDSMMLLSINKNSKEITLTSLLRDSYVEIPDHGWAKLNAAYVYGGAELLMDTIAQNFNVEVDDYVYVSFFSFIDIVDSVGGIELDVTDEEAQGMIDPMAEQNKYLGYEHGTDYLSGGGNNLLLNGNQALAYARLRYVGNADFERTDRQRTVINKIIEKAKTLNPLELDNFVKTTCRELTTNMSDGDMYIMFYKLLFSMTYDMNELRLPQEGAYYYGNHDGQSTLDPDFAAVTEELREKVYH